MGGMVLRRHHSFSVRLRGYPSGTLKREFSFAMGIHIKPGHESREMPIDTL